MVDERDNYLQHYGVMGMKWGVRNAETLRKYHGGNGRPRKALTTVSRGIKTGVGKVKIVAKKGAGKVGQAAKAKADQAKASFEQKQQEKKDVRNLEIRNGIKSRKARKAFDKIRKQTLASHNPEVIAKGMHTLTDSELDFKIKRLKKEQEVLKIANENRSNRADALRKTAEAKKAKHEQFNSSFPAKLASDSLRIVVGNATKNLKVKPNIDPKNNGDDNKRQQKNEPASKRKITGRIHIPNQQTQTQSTTKSQPKSEPIPAQNVEIHDVERSTDYGKRIVRGLLNG